MSLTEATELAPRLRELLEGLPDDRLPITYQQLAEALGLAPPGTIRRVAGALETLMEEDVEAGRPMIAALVVSRRGDLPRQGFFDRAVALGRFPDEPQRHAEAYRAEYREAVALRGTTAG